MTTAPPPAAKPSSEIIDLGVYYRDEDYAGLLRRLTIDAIDAMIALGVSAVASTLVWNFTQPGDDARRWGLTAAWFGVWFAYFVLLKRAGYTIGYLASGVRIVNLRGERAGFIALTFRLLFALYVNFILDLLWIGNDTRKQALRDKFAATYVIRRDAQPAGTGPIQYQYFDILGLSLLFAEVTKPDRLPSDD